MENGFAYGMIGLACLYVLICLIASFISVNNLQKDDTDSAIKSGSVACTFCCCAIAMGAGMYFLSRKRA